MGKFNPATYRPQDDSSTNTDVLRTNDATRGAVILRQRDGECLCGCGQPPVGRSSVFRMGHDARYRGKLIRAHITGAPVMILRQTEDGEVLGAHSALEMAEEHGWGDYLKLAKEREDLRAADRADRESARLLAEVTGPQPGDRKLIKVGRWEYTGQVLAVFENGADVEYQYVTSRGDRRTVINPDVVGEAPNA